MNDKIARREQEALDEADRMVEKFVEDALSTGWIGSVFLRLIARAMVRKGWIK